MIRIFMLLSALVALTACGNRGTRPAATDPTSEIAETTVDPDLLGTYTGTLPAADCPGIAITLTLLADGSYTLRSEYLERDLTYNEQGRFAIEGERLTLHPNEGEPATYYRYRIEENSLRLLGSDGRPFTGSLADHYVLTRKTDR